MKLKNYVRKLFYKMSGTTAEFSLENRLFNIVTFTGSVLLVITLVANYLLGLDYKINLAVFMLLIMHTFLYYKARFLKQSKQVILPYLFTTTALFGLAWFFNAGSNGPMILLFYNLTLMAICTTPYTQHFFWVSLTTLVGIALYVTEFFMPELVIPYESSSQKIGDMMFVFLIGNFISFIMIRALKNSYDSERYKAEEQNLLIKQQNIYLENSNLVKDRLFTVLAHDLRSPLTSIRSMMNVFEEEIKSNEEVRDIAAQIDERLKYNLQLLDDLMIWSNSKQLHRNADKSVFSLSELVNYTAPIFQPIAEKKNINFRFTIEKDANVLADKNMMKAVLRNLISNALKFTQVGGEVSVYTIRNNAIIEIVVHDSGVGISPDKLNDIFTEKHVSTPGTEKEHGSGIGLLLTRGFIQQNGSELKIESVVGEGTKMSFTLLIA